MEQKMMKMIPVQSDHFFSAVKLELFQMDQFYFPVKESLK